MEVGTSMSERPYHKIMVANISVRKIRALEVKPFFSSTDLVATIFTYFDFNTSSVDMEVVTVVDKIRAVFYVKNLINLDFRNQ